MPTRQYYKIVIRGDDKQRKLVNECPHCERRLSEGYFYLELQHDGGPKSGKVIGAVASSGPIFTTCCGEVQRQCIRLFGSRQQALYAAEDIGVYDGPTIAKLNIVSADALRVTV